MSRLHGVFIYIEKGRLIMDIFKKKWLEKLKGDKEVIKEVKEENEQEHTETEDKTKNNSLTAAEQKTQDIKAAIDAAYENQKDINCILKVMRLFIEGVFWVPATISFSQEDQEQFLNASKGDSISLKSNGKMKPDILKDPNGLLYFPAFTAREETDETYRNRFSWIQLPGKQILSIAKADNSLSGIVINAFSKGFTMTRAMLDLITGQDKVQEHTIEKGKSVLFLRLDDSCKGLRKAAEDCLSWKHMVKKAFFAKMFVDGKPESYCLVVDGNINDGEGSVDPAHCPEPMQPQSPT